MLLTAISIRSNALFFLQNAQSALDLEGHGFALTASH